MEITSGLQPLVQKGIIMLFFLVLVYLSERKWIFFLNLICFIFSLSAYFP